MAIAVAMSISISMRASSAAAEVGPRGIRRLFSTFGSSSFASDQSAKPPPAEPSTNLFVSGLNKRTTSEGLKEAFGKFGEVVYGRVVTDRVSGFSKGFGFVQYATLEESAAGIQGMDGKFLDGWVIFAEYAKPRAPLPSVGNNNNAGFSSYRTPYGPAAAVRH